LFAAKRYTRQVTHDLHLIAIGKGGFVSMQPRVQWALKILQLELSNKQSPIENLPEKITKLLLSLIQQQLLLIKKEMVTLYNREQKPVNFKKVDAHVHQFKGSSSR
jgi:hypothetical protein